jgi:hypothetical protein
MFWDEKREVIGRAIAFIFSVTYRLTDEQMEEMRSQLETSLKLDLIKLEINQTLKLYLT